MGYQFLLKKDVDVSGSFLGLFGSKAPRPEDGQVLVVLPSQGADFVVFPHRPASVSISKGEGRILSLEPRSSSRTVRLDAPQKLGSIQCKVDVTYRLKRDHGSLIQYAKAPVDDQMQFSTSIGQVAATIPSVGDLGNLEKVRQNYSESLSKDWNANSGLFEVLTYSVSIVLDKKAEVGRLASEMNVFGNVATELAAATSDAQLESIRSSLTAKAAANQALAEQRTRTKLALSDCRRLNLQIDDQRLKRIDDSYSMSELRDLESYIQLVMSSGKIRERCENILKDINRTDAIPVRNNLIEEMRSENDAKRLSEIEAELRELLQASDELVEGKKSIDKVRKNCQDVAQDIADMNLNGAVEIPKHLLKQIDSETDIAKLIDLESHFKLIFDVADLVRRAPANLIPPRALEAARFARTYEEFQKARASILHALDDWEAEGFREKCALFVRQINGPPALATALEEKFVKAGGDVMRALKFVAEDLFGEEKVRNSGLQELAVQVVSLFFQLQAANPGLGFGNPAPKGINEDYSNASVD